MIWTPSPLALAAIDPMFAAWLGLPLTACLTLALAAWARRRGLMDRAEGALEARKLQARPVAPVGGLAMLLALAMLWIPSGTDPGWSLGWTGSKLLVSPGVGGLSLLLVLLVGLWDDLLPAGLGPLAKLSAQAFALLPLTLGSLGELAGQAGASLGPGGQAAMMLLFGLLGLNAFNTFDNADGALGSVASVGLLVAWVALGFPSAGAAPLAVTLGFLVCNLNASASPGAPRGSSTPSAYLGDSGAYLLALLVMLNPLAICALWIPTLDLMRLCALRLSLGSRPWIGDRRHLAHRLQRCGLEARAVALSMALLALPGCIGALWWPEQPRALCLGLALGALGFLGAIGMTRKGASQATGAGERKR